MQEQSAHVSILSVLGEITTNTDLDMCEQCALVYLCAAPHANVVSLRRDQCAQLCLVGPLPSVRRGDGQQQRVIVSNQQLGAVPARGKGFAHVKGTLLQLQGPPDLVLWFLVAVSVVVHAPKKKESSPEWNVPHADNNYNNVRVCQGDRMFV